MEERTTDNENVKEQQLLPDELWEKILENVDDFSVIAFASVCKQLRRVQKRSGRRLETNLEFYKIFDGRYWIYRPIDKELTALSKDWCLWSMSSLTLKEEKGKRRRIMNAAAFWGHLIALKQWKEQSHTETLFDEQTCIFASLGGQLEVLKYLHHEKGCHWDIWTSVAAAREGHLDVLKYLHENHCPWDEWTCARAAEGGHLDVLEYLHEKGCPWNRRTCELAALRGHLEVLEYLHEKGCPWNERTCTSAAVRGHLEVLKYAHEKGCPWDEETCSGAALGGHLEVLQYAYEKGCPWDEATCMYAALI